MNRFYMYRFYVGAVFFVCTQQAAFAQLPNNALGHIHNVVKPAITTTEKIKKKTEQATEHTTEHIAEQVNTDIDQLATITDRVAGPLIKLPQRLPIVTSSGETAFVDVEVEHGWRAVEHEWLIMLDDAEFAILQKLPIQIIGKTRFDELDLTLVRFRVPAELDSYAALKKQLPEELFKRLDRNHIYAAQTAASSSISAVAPLSNAVCGEEVKLGIIDTAIKTDHNAFKNSAGKQIIERDFLEGKFSEPDAHGTAVASLLIGEGEELKPLLPKAMLYSASVFFSRNENAQGATMINLVSGLNWLMTENVSVINMSLAGPDNQILAKVVAKALSKGKVIVAAAGNEGPAAPPMFPAAYPGVIAATAVDRDQHIYRWANRGNYISFSALGVSVIAARSTGGFGRESGTSMAAPVISAFIGCELQHKISVAEALTRLTSRAIDLGDKGRDDIYGYGLLDQTSNAQKNKR